MDDLTCQRLLANRTLPPIITQMFEIIILQKKFLQNFCGTFVIICTTSIDIWNHIFTLEKSQWTHPYEDNKECLHKYFAKKPFMVILVKVFFLSQTALRSSIFAASQGNLTGASGKRDRGSDASVAGALETSSPDNVPRTSLGWVLLNIIIQILQSKPLEYWNQLQPFIDWVLIFVPLTHDYKFGDSNAANSLSAEDLIFDGSADFKPPPGKRSSACPSIKDPGWILDSAAVTIVTICLIPTSGLSSKASCCLVTE